MPHVPRPLLSILIFVSLWCGLPVSAYAAPAELPASVLSLLTRYRIGADEISIFAQELGGADPIIAHAPDVPRNPASTLKLLTTLVALEELGPAYTWKTEAYGTGPIRNGRLEGDLYLKGYGDPYLVTETFWQLLRGLRQMGVHEITGDLVLDDTYLDPGAGEAGSFDGQATRAYNTEPRALLINFQAVNFRFLPGANRRVQVVADPLPANLVIENKLTLRSGPCRSWNAGLRMQVLHRGNQNVVRFSGRYPEACGERAMYRVISDAPHYVLGVFKALWADLGGKFRGGLQESALPEDARRLHGVESRTLAEILRSINKYSNNVMTRQLLLTLGAERAGAPGTVDKGLVVMQDWLRRQGLSFPELVVENGSGLSRAARISARHLGEVLARGYNSAFMPEFVSSLPLAGTDGTLHNRFVGTTLERRLRAKTGSLDEVKSIAGYMIDQRGRQLVVVCIQNHAAADTAAGERVQEALLSWLYERP